MSEKAPAPPLADLQPVRRALISVSDKRGIAELGKALAARGVEILSTGGTFKALEGAGVPVTQVSDYTGSPEVMGGRVKTLHPKVHGGILMRGDIDDADLQKIGGKPIDMVVVNLYPFEQTVAKGTATDAEIVEEIDIGGPSMVRSAAKGHPRVVVLVDPADYATVLGELDEKGGTTLATRRTLAAKAFAHTAAYDGAIAAWMSSGARDAEGADATYPRYLTLAYEKGYKLRYGENPHQTGAFYRERNAPEGTLARAESLGAGGKELSFNNFVDVQAALDAVRELDPQAAAGCVIVKHTNPCGTAVAPSLEAAYRTARDADPVSAFVGIVALNREVDEATAKAMAEIFLECIVAPLVLGRRPRRAPREEEPAPPRRRPAAQERLAPRLPKDWGRAGRDERRRQRRRRGREREGGDEARAHRRGAEGPRLRLARHQAREVERDRPRQARRRPRRLPHRRRRRGADVTRRVGRDRLAEGGGSREGERARVGCVLPVPGRGGDGGEGGDHGDRAAGWVGEGCGCDRGCRCGGDCDGVYGGAAL